MLQTLMEGLLVQRTVLGVVFAANLNSIPLRPCRQKKINSKKEMKELMV